MSTLKHASHTLLKSINQQKVLHLIYSECPISRVELAGKTGLSQQTVTNIVNRLLEDQVIVEGEPQSLESGSGRKRVPLLLNGSRFSAIGIELSGTSARGAVYNFQHVRLAEAEVKADRYETEEDLLRVIRSVIDKLMGQTPDPTSLKGIGFSVHGLVDSSEGILLRSPGLGWKRIPLAKLLENEYGLPVFLENDTNLLALNENMGGSLISSKSNVTLKLASGIGGAIVVEKLLVTGSSFVAGEVGHYKAFMPPYDYECYCGGRGCLTTLASSRGMLRTLGRSVEQFREAIRAGDPETVQLCEMVRSAIVYAVANIVTLLNPDRVLLTGFMLPVWGDSFVDELKARVIAQVPQTCRNVEFLHLTDVEDETALAVGLVLQSVFKIPLDSLSL
ncbi:ROK family transcriptional regulator [Paenibacillus sp. Root444D2]|uniref:ROK family transcriptional regulator n=1 Tax=Paenibacillus sp. Root444D2 TaxID=1736538 RepID=UPI000710589F|nr:ROK family transcriptional regulator [Paenibacillus sp. Root444D2]KQX51827.1 ROK family transcriptional regulator [Paenibacillus sp. Root444D2]